MIVVVRADRCRRTRARDVALARHAVVHRRPVTMHNRRACGLWCTLRRTQLGKRARCCPSCWPSHVGVLGPMRYGRHGHAIHARRAGARQKCRVRTRHLPVGGWSGVGPTHPVPPDGRHAGYAIAETTRGRGRQTGRDVSATVWYALATTRRTPCQSPVLARRSLRRSVGRTPQR